MPALYKKSGALFEKKEFKQILEYLEEELRRSLSSMKKPGLPRVYYLSYLFRNQRYEKIWGRLGAVNKHEINSANTVFCDLRVGSYKYDNLINGGLNDNSDRDESYDYIAMPEEIHEDSFKFSLWKLTDARYREAAEQFYDKKTKELHFVDPFRRLPSRIKRKKEVNLDLKTFAEIDRDYWKHLIRKAGALIKKYPVIKNSWFEFSCSHNQSIIVNSEDSKIFRQSEIFELRGYLWLLNPQGEGISQSLNFIEGDINNLPEEKDFLRMIQEKLDLLCKIEKAPVLNSYSGPVLLSPEASGVFFHEVVGHRLEGSRLLSPEEGSTFRDLYGKMIAPEYIDIIDDPTTKKFGAKKMIGSFDYDDEGTPSVSAVLVEKGMLKNFLTTSAPLPGQKQMNGHARNQSFERPISRMGNLIIKNRKPTSPEEMKALFLEEIRKQKKEFGIRIVNVLGGETDTSAYDFQVFKGEILHAVKVYPDGREEAIRGVDFVGTPLSALDSVLCLGDDAAMSNSYCGAESGVIPVSTVSPSMLMRNLELQSRQRERYTQYMIPLPFSGKSK